MKHLLNLTVFVKIKGNLVIQDPLITLLTRAEDINVNDLQSLLTVVVVTLDGQVSLGLNTSGSCPMLPIK